MDEVTLGRGPIPWQRGLKEHDARSRADALNDARDPTAWWTYDAQEDGEGGWKVVSVSVRAEES